jgi:membrane-bound serine protease (ClpP class)
MAARLPAWTAASSPSTWPGRGSSFCSPPLREELLGWLINPNIALLFLVGGALLIYLEFNVARHHRPGALGTLMVLLAIFALNLLPIRYTAVLLLVAALVFIAA